ncbi:PREDICTED: uncharacterized protein LOC106118407 [Papilio xuthus]|uniref:Uncharacterized protein LOC106118407 n=1 Tax=Papilio xuthus TaxID=66420 RepID=A0AAJ7E9U7_PAPXU|nr:PREDICTED: uncharacterized protein LOC106118407 [Papilio xuthus]
MMHFLVLLAFFATAQSRAVNISNTWVLPEEGFPVFYRYFRDRISWYEADAVCQFHHANLVTVDTTAQYDAVRAYLKELDISSGVWVGLIRSNPEGDFTWTDYRGLSGDGYWSSAPDPRAAPLCAAADPTSDYRWEARACGGPTVASFICELPVPQWALGNEGCMVRALPALTILYLPESAAVQLTADCGLAGVKRVECTGNVKREDLLRDLSCAEEVESTSLNNLTLNSTITEIATSTENQEVSSISVTEENLSIEHGNENENLPSSVMSTPIPFNENIRQTTISGLQSTSQPIRYEMNKIILEKNVNLNDMQNNNLQSNDIPNLINNDNFLTNYRIQKMEDEENLQHKKLHDELARLGNFETIFTQPTDHFVPPLVMAKARISDDMNVLSLKEKHAQHFGTQDMIEKVNEEKKILNMEGKYGISTERPHTTENLAELVTESVSKLKNNSKKDAIKISLLKKYKELNANVLQISKSKTKKVNKETVEEIINKSTTLVNMPSKLKETTTLGTTVANEIQNDSNIELTVILRETNDERNFSQKLTNETDEGIGKNTTRTIIEFDQPTTEIVNFLNGTHLNLLQTQVKSNKTENILDKISTNSGNRNDTNISDIPQTLDFTTKLPVFRDDLINISTTIVKMNIQEIVNKTAFITTEISTITDDIQIAGSNSSLDLPANIVDKANYTEITETSHMSTKAVSTNVNSANQTDNLDHETSSTLYPVFSDAFNFTETVDETDDRPGDLETIDDFQSPLLSGANEPLQRPNRSRRPKQPNRVNKFNPFRILG